MIVGTLAVLLLFSIQHVSSSRPRPNILKRTNPTYSVLSDASLTSIANGGKELDAIINFQDPTSALARMLVPRAVGTDNLIRIQRMLVDHFERLRWHVEKDQFEEMTPYGMKSFTNLIFTHDVEANRRLLLAAHLDSKYFPTAPMNAFVGATDSAAPCAMLMDLAEALTPWLNARQQRIMDAGGEEGRSTQGETLQIVFFDGEEAFKEWTATDSVYGARHLAEKWSKPVRTPTATRPVPVSPIAQISHLILLDLLGSSHPIIRSFYPTTGWLFDEFMHTEQRLGSAGLLWDNVKGEDYTARKTALGVNERSFFIDRLTSPRTTMGGGVDDDHAPFLAKGVSVVHMIPIPFHPSWHTLGDDATALDLPTIKAWCLILRVTIAEYLGLDPSIESIQDDDEKARRRRRSQEELNSEATCALQ